METVRIPATYFEDGKVTYTGKAVFRENTWQEVREEVLPRLIPVRGDFTCDGQVTLDDAVYLLNSVFYPESYPLNQEGDLSADGTVDQSDAIYLLYSLYFPGKYPLSE